MSLIVDRLMHQAKILIGNQLGRVLSRQYSRGRGPVGRLISVFSDESKQAGVKQQILVAPVPLKKLPPDFCLAGEIESEYQNRIVTGEDFTDRAGVFSAQNVDVSFPTSMHQIGKHILNEVIPAPYLLTNPKYYYGLVSMRFKRKRPIGDGVLLSMPLYHNFYHWMIEILPRLISYDRCPHLQNVPLIVPKSAPSFVTESLRLAGYQQNTTSLEDGAYRFKTLHMLSKLVSMTEVSPDAVDWLNNKFPNIESGVIGPSKIYVSRRDAKIRFVSNETQLADVLSEFGFKTLVMSDLSLADQIGAFRNADFIIGPHGAAFANLAFSKPGSTIIEFFSRGHYSPSYNRISRIRKLKYGFLVGEPTRIGGFSINPNHLRRILSQALHS